VGALTKPGDSSGEEQAPDLVEMFADPTEMASVNTTAVAVALMVRRPWRTLALAGGAPLLVLLGISQGLPTMFVANALPLLALSWLHLAIWNQIAEAAKALDRTPHCSLGEAIVRAWPLLLLALFLIGRFWGSTLLLFFSTGVVLGGGAITLPLVYVERAPGLRSLSLTARAFYWTPHQDRRVRFWNQLGFRQGLLAIPFQLGAFPLFIVVWSVLQWDVSPTLPTFLLHLAIASAGLIGVNISMGAILAEYLSIRTGDEGRSPWLREGAAAAQLPSDRASAQS
jgi:hypothetical protein